MREVIKATNRPRIGIYCPGDGTSGPWRYVHSILAALDPAEFEVIVFCHLPGGYEPRPWVQVVPLAPPGRPGPEQPAPGNQTQTQTQTRPALRSVIGRLVPGPLKTWVGFGREAWKLSRLLRDHRVDLLHTQNTGREESPVAARLAGARRVLGTFHVDSTYDLQNRWSSWPHRLLERVSNHSLHRAIAVSAATKADWVRRTGLTPERVVTIPNGVDPTEFQRRRTQAEARRALDLPTTGRTIIAGVGRLDQAKGFADLISALARLIPDHPDLLVVLAGEGSLRAALVAQADALSVADHVRFLGYQADVALVLEAADIFALPSLCEAMPFALLEASSLGLPVVGTAVGGVPEVIAPGVTGFVVPPRDPVALAAALRRLVADPNLRQRLGAAGRERVVRQFQVQETVDRTIAIYRDLLAPALSRPPAGSIGPLTAGDHGA